MIILNRSVILIGSTVFFACCLVRAGFSLMAPRPSNKVPTVDASVYDFGTMPTGSSIAHVFSICNRSNRDFKIEQVRSGCSCTTTEWNDNAIKPNGLLKLKATVSLDGLRGATEQHIVVKFGDPSQPQLLLKIVGQVNSEFNVKPPVINFGKVVQGQQLEGYADIDVIDSNMVELLAVDCESPLCQVSHEIIEEGRRYRVLVRMNGVLPSGFWKTSIRISTNSLQKSRLVLPVVAQVTAVPASVKEN